MKNQKLPEMGNRTYWLVAAIIVTILVAVTAILFLLEKPSKKPIDKKEMKSRLNYPVGSVKSCAINPVFPYKHGMKPPLLIDLRQKGYRGVRILENREDGKVLQLPGWSDFGWLGLYTLDNKGNIYLSSIPHESIQHNPVGEQNRILKIDSQTGEMTEFMPLPQKEPSTLKNPFGAMGLHFDCDHGFLYVSSVAGSTMKKVTGSIFQIDLNTKEIVSRLENVDAIGISTFNTTNGKRLYFGDARKPEIRSVGLDNEGRFIHDIRLEFSLLDQPGGAFDKAHRIQFMENIMEIKANDFNFTLAASSDPQRNIYRFRYDPGTDSWIFLEVFLQKQ
jgi:hypothetical protein